MILPKPLNDAFIFTRKYYLDIFGRWATPQYGVHILNGHYIDVDNDVSNERFFDTLNVLSKQVDFISFKEGSELVYQKKIPNNKKLLCFSFDDGFEENFTKIKPVLDAFNIKAAFFICPNFVEASDDYIDKFLKEAVFATSPKLPMSWAQIKTLHSEGHLIGSHTLNHAHCVTTPLAELDKELRGSKQIIEAQLLTVCEHFAYTYGKVEHFSLEALNCAEQYYKYIYSQAGVQSYFTYNGRVINRRHFEGNWQKHHLTYYLNKKTI